jgi:DNA invertase Pin-like site-specific DNA recombinase
MRTEKSGAIYIRPSAAEEPPTLVGGGPSGLEQHQPAAGTRPAREVVETERRCAIYIRTAAAADAQSIDARIEECRATAEAEGLVVAEGDVFVDNGVSGLDQHGGAAWRRLHAAVGAGEYGTIVMRDPTRITRRSPADIEEALRALELAGVTVLFADGSAPISTGRETILHMIEAAEAEIERRARVQLGIQASVRWRGRRAEAGFYPGKPPFGFMLRREEATPTSDQAAARRRDGRLIPDEATLPIVRLIFERLEPGTSCSALANELAAAGAIPPGARWTGQVVRRIATNPIYAGRLVLRSPSCPALDRTIHDFVPHPPITPERFDRLQARLNSVS